MITARGSSPDPRQHVDRDRQHRSLHRGGCMRMIEAAEPATMQVTANGTGMITSATVGITC
jgi:hypothetical protein